MHAEGYGPPSQRQSGNCTHLQMIPLRERVDGGHHDICSPAYSGDKWRSITSMCSSAHHAGRMIVVLSERRPDRASFDPGITSLSMNKSLDAWPGLSIALTLPPALRRNIQVHCWRRLACEYMSYHSLASKERHGWCVQTRKRNMGCKHARSSQLPLKMKGLLWYCRLFV